MAIGRDIGCNGLKYDFASGYTAIKCPLIRIHAMPHSEETPLNSDNESQKRVSFPIKMA